MSSRTRNSSYKHPDNGATAIQILRSATEDISQYISCAVRINVWQYVVRSDSFLTDCEMTLLLLVRTSTARCRQSRFHRTEYTLLYSLCLQLHTVGLRFCAFEMILFYAPCKCPVLNFTKILSQVLELFHACRQNYFDGHFSKTRTRVPIYHISCSNEVLLTSAVHLILLCALVLKAIWYLAVLVSTPNCHNHGMMSQLQSWHKKYRNGSLTSRRPTFDPTWDF